MLMFITCSDDDSEIKIKLFQNSRALALNCMNQADLQSVILRI